MTHTTYEIRLSGQLAPDRTAFLGQAKRFDAPAETVLVTRPIDQTDLNELIARLRDFGIELLELRRTAEGDPAKENPPVDRR